jgi:hypothetical protein
MRTPPQRLSAIRPMATHGSHQASFPLRRRAASGIPQHQAAETGNFPSRLVLPQQLRGINVCRYPCVGFLLHFLFSGLDWQPSPLPSRARTVVEPT